VAPPGGSAAGSARRARTAGGELAPASLHAYYAQRASAGLIITEGAWVSRRAIGFAGVPGIYSAAQVTAWRRVTSVVHALGGRIVLQLWHAGAHSHPDHHGGARPAGPSAVNPGEISPTPAGRKQTVTPREMTPPTSTTQYQITVLPPRRPAPPDSTAWRSPPTART
jgi:N-ethylmaleimide reductase